MKPTAIEITSWAPYKEVIYKCSKCGCDFRFFGTNELYCHHCGTKVDWKGILTKLPQSFDKNDYKGEEMLIAEINKRQLN